MLGIVRAAIAATLFVLAVPAIATADPMAEVKMRCIQVVARRCTIEDGWLRTVMVFRPLGVRRSPTGIHTGPGFTLYDEELAAYTSLFLSFFQAGGDVVRAEVKIGELTFEKTASVVGGSVKWTDWRED